MNTHVLIPSLVIVAILVVIAVALIAHRRRSAGLKRRFVPEYDRTVSRQQGDAHRTESTPLEREKSVDTFPLHDLTPVDREAYAMEWTAVQRRFVDDPAAAVGSADRLISRAMTDRGYPMAHFEQRAEDISVSYPVVVENYRAAHQIALRHADGAATTEELRQAMVHYRSLFEELVTPAEPSKVEPIDRRRGVARERAS